MNSANQNDNGSIRYTRTYRGGNDDVVVSNTNDATVDNVVNGGASTGGNESLGSQGDEGGNGGAVSTSGNNNTGSSSAGNGGMGGRGGNGGNVTSGSSSSYADILTTSGRTMTRVNRR
jgi:hypothetical protein